MMNAPQEEMIGKMIGEYQVSGILGSGGHGTVYRAHDPELGRDVALKVLRHVSPEYVERFRREARNLASVSHPNIATVFVIGEHNGSPFIAIEYVPHAASELVKRGAMDVGHAASIAYQTALALEEARVRGITHHDVKPDNLLLTSLDDGGVVKLTDFGIAHAASMASMTQIGPGMGMGTPLYMAPEQRAGVRGDTREDVYSLGVVMYQMLAGRVPFDSDAPARAPARREAIARQHKDDDAPPLRSVRADVSEDLEALVAKCMAKNPSERFQTPGELAGALDDLFKFRPRNLVLRAAKKARAPFAAAFVVGLVALSVVSVVIPVEVPVVTPFVEFIESQFGDDEPPPPAFVIATAAPAPTAAPALAPEATPTPTPTATPTPAPAPTATPIPTITPTPDNPNALADLFPVVDSFSWSPSNPSVGDEVTFTVEILNQGQRNSGASSLAYSIESMDGAKSGAVDVPPIAAGDSAEATFTWQAEAGHHNVEIEADADNSVVERAEGNNAVSQGLIYHGTLLADLAVVSIEWAPEKPELGQPVTFTATVNNAGDGRAASSTLRLYVDDDSAGVESLPSIQPGKTASADFAWTARAGTHRLTAVANESQTVSETNEDNNALSKPYDATLFVDLFVEDITWTPANPSVGDTVTFSATVANGGDMDAGEFMVALDIAALDAENVVEDADALSVALSGVPAGGSGVAEFEWTATPDEMNLVAAVNIDKALTETDYANNETAKVYNATALPDLVVDGIAWSPENPALGDEATVTLTVKNNGAGRASAASVNYLVDEGALSGELDFTALEADDSTELTFAWTAQKGEHEFSARVNSGESLIETDYANNAASVRYDNTRLANLTVDSATWSPQNPADGDEVTFSVTVRNAGDADAPAFAVEFRDESGGWRLDDFAFPNGIAAGASDVATFAWQADARAHDFAVSADSRGAVDESNEDDNTHRFAYDDTRTADLFIRDIQWNPQTPTLDADVPITIFVENRGTGDAGASVVRFVIEEEGQPHSDETRAMPAIAAGGSARLSFNWTARLGRFTFTATVDANDQILETNEDNNTLVNNYNDTVQADLAVDRIELIPDDPVAESEVEIRARVRNVGDGDAGRFRVALLVNGDLIDSDTIRRLPSGDDEWARFSFSWEYSGLVTFTVTADSEDDISEGDEGNNAREESVNF